MDRAGQTLLRDGVGDIRWLEIGLRETSTRVCRKLPEGLLTLPGLHIPEDERREGERCVGNVKRTIHTFFGDIEIKRNGYKTAEADAGRFPLDETLRLLMAIPRR